jgi:hypothetical protein
VVDAHPVADNALHARATGEATERTYDGPERRSFRKPFLSRSGICLPTFATAVIARATRRKRLRVAPLLFVPRPRDAAGVRGPSRSA